MADVKLALEELREESESGTLTKPKPAVGALAWSFLKPRPVAAPAPAELVRVSPEAGHSYEFPNLSADGKFVAYISDRGGTRQLWVQQVAGGNPISIAPASEFPGDVDFFPDGSKILYTEKAAGESGKRSVLIVSALGGEPRVVATGPIRAARLSPSGNLLAYTEYRDGESHLTFLPLSGGPARQSAPWNRQQSMNGPLGITWTPDDRAILAMMPKKAGIRPWGILRYSWCLSMAANSNPLGSRKPCGRCAEDSRFP